MPHRSSVPMSWRLAKHRYSLVGTKCLKCGSPHFPPRTVCSCGSQELESFEFLGKGKIISYTVIHAAPDGFERQIPYAVALVQLAEGLVISTQIAGDFSKIAIGKKVGVVFRKLYEDGKAGLINYGFKFELLD